MSSFVPSFVCTHCGEESAARVFANNSGVFTPCNCEGARRAREQEQRLRVESRKRYNRHRKNRG